MPIVLFHYHTGTRTLCGLTRRQVESAGDAATLLGGGGKMHATEGPCPICRQTAAEINAYR